MANALAERVKLTPDLFQISRRYMKAIGAVVTWLAADQDGSSWSLSDLMQAALASKTNEKKDPPRGFLRFRARHRSSNGNFWLFHAKGWELRMLHCFHMSILPKSRCAHHGRSMH